MKGKNTELTILDFADTEIERSGPQDNGEFTYVDIASIDRETKRIVEPKILPVEKAPSRAKQVLKTDDVLVSMTRPNLNAVAIVPKELDGSIGSTGFHVVRAKHADPRFLFYAVQCRDFINAMCEKVQGALYPAVRPDDITSFGLPPFSQSLQKRIVTKIEELFSELDAGEESFKQARKQLGIYRQSLLKQAFEGKLTEAWRADNPDKLEDPKQLLARIQQERESRHQQQLTNWQQATQQWEQNGKKGKKPAKPRKPKAVEPFTESEISKQQELPKGWVYSRLGIAITGIEAGKSFSCDERPPAQDEIGVAKVSALTWGEYDEDESKTCRDATKVVPEYFIRKGDFLLSRANTIDLVGAAVIVRSVTKQIMLSDKSLRIIFAGISEEFILQFLRSRPGRVEIMERSTGNQESMRNIGQDRICSIVTPLCSLPEQQEIVRLLEEQFTVIEQNEREIDAALERSAALRQSILKRAFTGQLVPQDPTDEPASVLLERIQAERKAQSELGRAKKTAKKKTARKLARKSVTREKPECRLLWRDAGA